MNDDQLARDNASVDILCWVAFALLIIIIACGPAALLYLVL